MKRSFLSAATLIIFLVASLHAGYAAPVTIGVAQNPKALSTDSKSNDDYISLRWMVYMMILSLPFAPSQTHYKPISIPVHLPSLNIPKPRLPAKTPALNIPKPRLPAKTPALNIPKPSLPEKIPSPSIPKPKPPVESKIDEPAH